MRHCTSSASRLPAATGLLSIHGWFPDFGTVLPDRLDTFPVKTSGYRRDLSFRYRCGGSAGIRPASQLSARGKASQQHHEWS